SEWALAPTDLDPRCGANLAFVPYRRPALVKPLPSENHDAFRKGAEDELAVATAPKGTPAVMVFGVLLSVPALLLLLLFLISLTMSPNTWTSPRSSVPERGSP